VAVENNYTSFKGQIVLRQSGGRVILFSDKKKQYTTFEWAGMIIKLDFQ